MAVFSAPKINPSPMTKRSKHRSILYICKIYPATMKKKPMTRSRRVLYSSYASKFDTCQSYEKLATHCLTENPLISNLLLSLLAV